MMWAARVLLSGGHVNSYPLVFDFRDLIAGRGFIAAIRTCGRGVLSDEPEGWTLYGINPGGMAGCAESREGALADFRRTYTQVLDDIVRDARDFEAFKAGVEAFVAETNRDAGGEWETLRERVRSGDLSLEMERRATADFVPHVEVRLVEPGPTRRETWPTPEMNPGGTYYLDHAA